MHALTAAFLVGLIGTSASADVWVSGTICTEGIASVGDVFDYNGGSLANPSSQQVAVSCPIPVDQNVGTSQQFQMRVEDNHTTQDFLSCIGLVIGTDGEILASTNSDSTSGTGEDILSLSTTTGVSSDDYSYFVLCNMPGNGSRVENIRVY